nr:glycosyltransferase [Methanosarcina horonobensis]
MPLIPMEPLIQVLYSISVYSSLRALKKPDIIHTHDISQAVYCSIVGKIFKIPVVGMLHGSTSAYSPVNGMYETILAKLSSPSHAFVLDDGSEAPYKFKKLWGDKVSIVYHAIDTELFNKLPTNKGILKKLKIENAEFIVLSTSSLITVKKYRASD